MSRVLNSVLRRLAAPHVALRLDKFELCLSLAATAALSSDLRLESEHKLALLGRTAQLTPTMTAQDLGIVAQAMSTFKWTDPLLLDSVAHRLFVLSSDKVILQLHQLLPVLELFSAAAAEQFVSMTYIEALRGLQLDCSCATEHDLAAALESVEKIGNHLCFWDANTMPFVSILKEKATNFPQLTYGRSSSSAARDRALSKDNARIFISTLLSARGDEKDFPTLLAAMEAVAEHNLIHDIVLVQTLDKVAAHQFSHTSTDVEPSTRARALSTSRIFERVHAAVANSSASGKALMKQSDNQIMLGRRMLGLDCSVTAVISALDRLSTLEADEVVAATCALLPQITANEMEFLFGCWSTQLDNLSADAVYLLVDSVVKEILDSKCRFADHSKTAALSAWIAVLIDHANHTQQFGRNYLRLATIVSRLLKECMSVVDLVSHEAIDGAASFAIRALVEGPSQASLADLCLLLQCGDSMLSYCGSQTSTISIEQHVDVITANISNEIERITESSELMKFLESLSSVENVPEQIIDCACRKLQKLNDVSDIRNSLELARAASRADVLDFDAFVSCTVDSCTSVDMSSLSVDSRINLAEAAFSLGRSSVAADVLGTLTSCSLTSAQLREIMSLVGHYGSLVRGHAVLNVLLTHVNSTILALSSSDVREFCLTRFFACCHELSVDVARCSEIGCLQELERVAGLSAPNIFTSAVCAVLSSSWDNSVTASFVNSVVVSLPDKARQLGPVNFSSTIRALGTTGTIGFTLPQHLAVDRLSDFAVDQVCEWSGQQVVDLLAGLSMMQCTKRSVYSVFSNFLARRPVASNLRLSTVGGAIAAFASSKFVDIPLLNTFSKKAIRSSHLAGSHEVVKVLCGFSRMMLHDGKLYEKMGDRAVALLNEIAPEDAVKVIAAYSHVGVFHDELLAAVVSHCSQNVAQLSGNSAATLLAAAWQMSYGGDLEHLEKLADHVAANSESLTADAIKNVCVVLQSLSWRHGKLLLSLASQASRLAASDSLPAESSRIVLDTLGMFLVHHTQAREALATGARSISRDVVQASEEEMDEIKRKALGSR